MITQEMLKKGYLGSNIFYPSIAHSDEIIDNYIYNLEDVFDKISNLYVTNFDKNINPIFLNFQKG